jgi:hypothetical protein
MMAAGDASLPTTSSAADDDDEGWITVGPRRRHPPVQPEVVIVEKDSRGGDAYPQRRRQKSSRRSHLPKSMVGNTTSLSHSRPQGPYPRMLERGYLQDMIRHEAFDQRVTASRISRKTMAADWESARPRTANQHQLPPSERQGHRRREESLSKVVALPAIMPGLFLCNRAFFESVSVEFLQQNYICNVVNMTRRRYDRIIATDIAVHELAMADDRHLATPVFVRKMREISTLLTTLSLLPDRTTTAGQTLSPGVLLFCEAGTNRSCSAAIFHAIATQRMSLADALTYIESQKEQAMTELQARMVAEHSLTRLRSRSRRRELPPAKIYWDTLTNPHFRALLTMYAHQHQQTARPPAVP